MHRLYSLSQWYSQRSIRERVLLLLCALALLVVLVYLLVLNPLVQRKSSAAREISLLKGQQTELQTRENIVLARKGVDPDHENKKMLEVLTQESMRLQDQLTAGIVNLVAPRDMPGLLKDLLTQQKSLQLVSLENLPPRQLVLGPQDSKEQAGPILYLHPLKMEFKGDYLTLLKYLRQLEGLPKALVWEDVDIETKTYPTATVRIQVYTLSLTEGWIGG